MKSKTQFNLKHHNSNSSPTSAVGFDAINLDNRADRYIIPILTRMQPAMAVQPPATEGLAGLNISISFNALKTMMSSILFSQSFLQQCHQSAATTASKHNRRWAATFRMFSAECGHGIRAAACCRVNGSCCAVPNYFYTSSLISNLSRLPQHNSTSQPAMAMIHS